MQKSVTTAQKSVTTVQKSVTAVQKSVTTEEPIKFYIGKPECKKKTNMARLQSNLANSLHLKNTSLLGSSNYFTHIYHDVMGVNLKFLRKKGRGAIAM